MNGHRYSMKQTSIDTDSGMAFFEGKSDAAKVLFPMCVSLLANVLRKLIFITCTILQVELFNYIGIFRVQRTRIVKVVKEENHIEFRVASSSTI